MAASPSPDDSAPRLGSKGRATGLLLSATLGDDVFLVCELPEDWIGCGTGAAEPVSAAKYREAPNERVGESILSR